MILSALFLVFNLSTAQSSLGLSNCSTSNSYTTCEFTGKTGLEFLDQVNEHDLQRRILSFGDRYGSIFLIENVVSEALGNFNACWGVTDEKDSYVFLMCSNDEEFSEQIPDQILNMLIMKRSF